MGENWTSAQCADAWGVKVPTWLGYVSRGQAPAPLPALGDAGRRLWDADEVRAFPRPGVGHSRSGAGAEDLLEAMRDTAEQLAALQARQRDLLAEGRTRGLEVSAMARALGISRQTATKWLS